MANYTMQVRTICEYYAGVESSKGFNSVDEIIDNSWNAIFTTPITFYTNECKERICKKILKRYYTREIGAETAGLWQLWINQRLEEIEPYYAQLYKSAEIEISPLENYNYTETVTRSNSETSSDVSNNTTNSKINTNDSSSNSGSKTKNNHEEGANNNEKLHSDTPQSELAYVEEARYISDANFEKGGHTINSNGTENSSGTETKESETKQNVTSEENRNRSGTSQGKDIITKAGNVGSNESEMLLKYRETILNIDKMVIEEFQDLFFMLF